MEFVDGQSLKEKLAWGPLKLQKAINIITQVAEGLHAAHERGIVHRDIKSANIMVLDKTGTITRGQPAVTDTLIQDFPAGEEELLRLAASVEKGVDPPPEISMLVYPLAYGCLVLFSVIVEISVIK